MSGGVLCLEPWPQGAADTGACSCVGLTPGCLGSRELGDEAGRVALVPILQKMGLRPERHFPNLLPAPGPLPESLSLVILSGSFPVTSLDPSGGWGVIPQVLKQVSDRGPSSDHVPRGARLCRPGEEWAAGSRWACDRRVVVDGAGKATWRVSGLQPGRGSPGPPTAPAACRQTLRGPVGR